jgi:secreted trypsin-like serine protease
LVASLPTESKPKIVNGSFGSISEFPFLVGLINLNAPDAYEGQFCGGSRVSQTKIITAAHCVVDNGFISNPAVLGALYGTSDLQAGGTLVQVTQVAVHPFYRDSSFESDVAVLTVDAPRTPVPVVETITSAAENTTSAGRVAKLAGWGCAKVLPAIYGDCADYPQTLRRTDLPMQSPATCANEISGFNAASMICAGSVSDYGYAPDACYGDSGGPLVVAGAQGPLLAGVVSFGPGCGGSPTAYTRLAVQSTWLQSQGVPLRAAPFTPAALQPQVSGSYLPLMGDFNGNGYADCYWYAPGSAVEYLWTDSRSGLVPGAGTRQVSGSYIPIVGNFDGDPQGDDDIFWYAPGGAPEGLYRSDQGVFRAETAPSVNGTYTPLSGDFDGNGTDDIFWYAPGPAGDFLWLGLSNGNFFPIPVTQVNGSYQPAVGDFDGNGTDDIFWYAPGSGTEYIWRGVPAFASAAVLTAVVGPSPLQLNGVYRLLSGDYDGDNKSDLLGYGIGSANDLMWRGSSSGFNRATDVAVNGSYQTATGDMNQDGRDDVLWHGPGPAYDGWWSGINVG